MCKLSNNSKPCKNRGKIKHFYHNKTLILFLLAIICTSPILIQTIPIDVIAANNLDADTTRNGDSLVFVESSKGLPTSGDYNFIELADINNDNKVDIAFGSGGWPVPTTLGLYAYTGDGGSFWASSSDGLPSRNTWGGLELVDADEDGYIELYAPDEPWGSSSNSGVKVWEFRDGSWTDSIIHVSSPVPVGVPNNVVVTDITGNSRPDMVVCKNTGLNYFQNTGGNPITWEEYSEGLATTKEFTGAAVADINKDGLMDIIASDYSGNEYIYIQSTTGALWSDYSTSLDSGGITYGIAIDDVNSDSHMDLVFGTTGGGLLCWLGNSGGSSGTDFQWVNGSADLFGDNIYSQIQLVDIDQDGDLDIIGPEGKNGKGIHVYLGNGNNAPGMDISWELAQNTNLPNDGDWYGTNCCDINDDGALDIIGASWGNGVGAWLNNINGDLKKFNLRINPEDIAFSPETLQEGDEVTIKTKIVNDGDLDAPGFKVKFFIDDEQIEPEDNVDLLMVNDEITLEKSWTAIEGSHIVLVEIELLNYVFEFDITDNSAEKSFYVKPIEPGNDNINNDKSNDSNQNQLMLTFLIAVIVILLMVIYIWRKRKKVKFSEVEPLEEEDD